MENLKFKIDFEKLNQKAKEAAEKAFISEVESYYTSYDSPYRKAIKEHLKKQEINIHFTLPDILVELNKALKNQMDTIANTAIANTYLPIINQVFNLPNKNIKLSEILKDIIHDIYDEDICDSDDFEFSFKKHESYGWLNCFLKTPQGEYDFTLHESHKGVNTYKCAMLPMSKQSNYYQKVKIKKDNVEMEIPAHKDILNDIVFKHLFSAGIGGCIIEIDVESIEDWMFPEDNECHC